MPKYDFDFEIVADQEGNLQYEQSLNIPIRVKLKRIRIKTLDGCKQRSHSITVRVNDEIWAKDQEIRDCEPLDFSKSVKVDAGQLTLAVESQGFDPGEPVRGEGWIEYGLAIF